MAIFPAFHRYLHLVAMALALGLGGMPCRAQAQGRGDMGLALADWKAAVQARLQIEDRWPGTGKLFAGQEPGDRGALSEALSTDKSEGVLGAWVAVARALALHAKAESHEAEGLFQAALAASAGHPGLLFEGALVLQRAGQSQRAKLWQQRLGRELLILGYARAPGYAKSVLAEARRDMGRKQWVLAKTRIDFARSLDPLSPWNAAARFEVALRSTSPWNWNMGEIWSSLGEIVGLMRYVQNGLPFLFNTVHCLRLVLQGMGLFLLIALILRHYARTVHLLAEKLPRVVDITWRYLAIALAGLSLWVMGVGLLYLAAPIVLALWGSARPSERGLFRLIFMGLLTMPILLTVEHALLRHLDPREGLHFYDAAYESGFDPELVRRIEAFEPADATDRFYRSLALSLQYRKLGNTLKAQAALRDAEASKAYPSFLSVHQGNLAMMTGQYAEAEKQYLAALREAPTWVEAWFNASQAALFQNRSDAHKQRLEKAADADATYLTLFLKQNDDAFETAPVLRRSMDPMPRFEMALKPVLGEFANLSFLREEMGSGLLTVPSWALIALTLACMIAVAIRQNQSVRIKGKTTFTCKICGKVMCRHCRKGVHCEACYKSVVGVSDQRLREELVARMRQRSHTLTQTAYRALNTAMPGLGDLYVGAGGIPLLWLLLSVTAWAMLLQVSHPLMEYPALSLGLFAWVPWAPLIAVYALYNAFTYLPGGRRLVMGTQREIEL